MVKAPKIRATLTTPSEEAYRSSLALRNDQSFPNSSSVRCFRNDLNTFQMTPMKNADRVLTIPDVPMILDQPAQARRVQAKQVPATTDPDTLVQAKQAPATTDPDTLVQAQPAPDKSGPNGVPAIPDVPMADTAGYKARNIRSAATPSALGKADTEAAEAKVDRADTPARQRRRRWPMQAEAVDKADSADKVDEACPAFESPTFVIPRALRDFLVVNPPTSSLW
jgi:hypothetical protein